MSMNIVIGIWVVIGILTIIWLWKSRNDWG